MKITSCQHYHSFWSLSIAILSVNNTGVTHEVALDVKSLSASWGSLNNEVVSYAGDSLWRDAAYFGDVVLDGAVLFADEL